MLSILINIHLVLAARDRGVEKYFFASSACVYASDKQTSPEFTALAEADAYTYRWIYDQEAAPTHAGRQ